MQSIKQRFAICSSTLLLALGFLTTAPLSLGQDFVWAPDFPVGSQLPDIHAPDQNGDLQTAADLMGEKGLLFMLSRSFDW